MIPPHVIVKMRDTITWDWSLKTYHVIDCVPLSLEFLDNMLHTQLLSYCVIGCNLLKQPVPVSLICAAIWIHICLHPDFSRNFFFVWWNVPMVQALIPVLHLLLPRAYFSASNGSGDELSSYLKVKSVVAIGKKLVQLEWVPIGGTRFFHLLPVPPVIYTLPLFVYQVIILCKLQRVFFTFFWFYLCRVITRCSTALSQSE